MGVAIAICIAALLTVILIIGTTRSNNDLSTDTLLNEEDSGT